jgi:hypothetical protein
VERHVGVAVVPVPGVGGPVKELGDLHDAPLVCGMTKRLVR